MDNYIKAIEERIVLARRCLPIFNGNAALKLQLEDEMLKFEQLQNKFLHARLAAVHQPPTVVQVVSLSLTDVPVVPLSSSVVPLPPPSHTIAAAPSATVTTTTGTVFDMTSTSAATILASQKYTVYFTINTCDINYVDLYNFSLLFSG